MKKSTYELNAIFSVASEMIRDNGEDSFYYDVDGNDFIISAFDGLGGAGSKKYGNYSGKTGAYIGSRAVNGGVKEWFFQSKKENELEDYVKRSLAVCMNFGDKASRLKSSLTKDFPTTAAIIKGTVSKKKMKISCYWAGDSRCYFLDADGLHQLSKDDLEGQDALSNLTDDGIMTNVISASAPFRIHHMDMEINKPCILIAATDGCFGYLKSPMAFEYLITDSLDKVKSMQEWKEELNARIKDVTGDDHTLSVALCGFDDFKSVQHNFLRRRLFVEENYLGENADIAAKWNLYRKSYEMYMQR